MIEPKIIRVLFVCTGNYCRSPMAEAVFKQMVKQAGLEERIDVESAGTDHWHVGSRPHSGTVAILSQHGIGVDGKRARQLTRHDMGEFEYVVAMDQINVDDIYDLFKTRVPRLLDFAPPGSPRDVPDPYYEGNFERVYDLVTAGCRGLLDTIRKKENL